nr:site-specific integrase [Pseudomonas duriflava]
MAYITRRETTYYLNLRLPKHVDFMRSTLRLSLGVTERKTALFIASRLAYKVFGYLADHQFDSVGDLKRLCKEWLKESLSDIPERPLRATSTALRATPPKKEPTLEKLAKLYIEEGKRTGAWREGNTQDVERVLRDFFELIGDRTPQDFTPADARLFKELLKRCPQYFGLRPEFSGKPLREIIGSGIEYTPISTTTVNNRLRKVSAFFNWCMQNKYITENPLKGIKVMVAVSAKEARHSFTPADLNILLDLQALRKESLKHVWRFWLVLLGRTTGARMEELCQLHADDITTIQGSACIRISDTHADQKVKTPSSRRIIPIHPQMIRLGFLEYVHRAAPDGVSRIFPELIAVRGQLGHAPSKWFGRYKQKQGITDPRKVFHSFRHTFIDDLREAGVQDSVIKRLVGHEDGSVTFGLYGSREPIKAMADAINSIDVTPLST